MVSHSKEHYSVREECRQRTRLELLCYIGNAYFSQVSHCGIIIVLYEISRRSFWSLDQPSPLWLCTPTTRQIGRL